MSSMAGVIKCLMRERDHMIAIGPIKQPVAIAYKKLTTHKQHVACADPAKSRDYNWQMNNAPGNVQKNRAKKMHQRNLICATLMTCCQL